MRRTLLAAVSGALLLSACGSAAEPPADAAASPASSPTAPTATSPSEPAGTEASSPTPSPEATESSTPAAPALTEAELAELGVNELGRVLVMEYHKLQDADGRWENSLATFRAQLQELHDRGYRPISVEEFIDGTFPIPAGTSPVLLTFDDSYREHMFFGPDGETPDPDSVVGILQAMEAEDPTWRARAHFAYYWPVPFRDTDRDVIERKLRYLVEHGFDLSNHTYNHDNLRELSDAEVVENLAKSEKELAAVVGDDYRVRSITLTQGIWPQNEALAMTGTWDGFTYDHDIALEVGFMPTRSPHHVDYDPKSVQRVQAYVPEFDKWVAWLDEEPNRRFVSDGDPTTVTYPASFAEVAAVADTFTARTYGEPEPTPTP